jgi:hypothetical protein
MLLCGKKIFKNLITPNGLELVFSYLDELSEKKKKYKQEQKLVTKNNIK